MHRLLTSVATWRQRVRGLVLLAALLLSSACDEHRLPDFARPPPDDAGLEQELEGAEKDEE